MRLSHALFLHLQTLPTLNMVATPSLFESNSPGSLGPDGTFVNINAAAQALDGFTVRQDFMSAIRNYLRKNVILWNLIKKEAAETDVVKEMREGVEPSAAFFSKTSMNPPETESDFAAHDLTDPGQQVKAVGGLFKISHYARSLYQQQGRPYGDIIAKKTSDLIASTAKTLERGLIHGDASADPLQFNGILRQMNPAHSFTADKIAGDSVIKKIRSVVRLAVNDDTIMRNVTHILTSGLGMELIEEEAETKLEYMNLDQVRPGLRVPGIITQGDSQGAPTPIITSPYLIDDPAGTGRDYDTVHFYLLDMNQIVWKGVRPEGGTNSFEPQIFEVTQFTSNGSPYLVEKRMCICYGTLYCGNRGESIYRLSVRVPSGTIGNI